MNTDRCINVSMLVVAVVACIIAGIGCFIAWKGVDVARQGTAVAKQAAADTDRGAKEAIDLAKQGVALSKQAIEGRVPELTIVDSPKDSMITIQNESPVKDALITRVTLYVQKPNERKKVQPIGNEPRGVREQSSLPTDRLEFWPQEGFQGKDYYAFTKLLFYSVPGGGHASLAFRVLSTSRDWQDVVGDLVIVYGDNSQLRVPDFTIRRGDLVPVEPVPPDRGEPLPAPPIPARPVPKI